MNQSFWKRVGKLLAGTYRGFMNDNCFQLAAGLSYYAVFSLAPLLFLVVAVFGFLGGSSRAMEYISTQASEAAGPEVAAYLVDLVHKAYSPSKGWLATGLAFGTLFMAATTFLTVLQKSLNIVWGVQAAKSGGVGLLVRDRVRSLGLILLFGVVLFVSLAASTALKGAADWLLTYVSSQTLARIDLGQRAATFLLLWSLFGLLFKLLPDASVRWRDVGVGAFLTTVLFGLGKEAISLYLARSNLGMYGPAGTVIAMLLWVNYSSLILLLGAEFTQQWADVFGRDIRSRFEDKSGP